MVAARAIRSSSRVGEASAPNHTVVILYLHASSICHYTHRRVEGKRAFALEDPVSSSRNSNGGHVRDQ